MGFTMVEMLVTISIVCILAALVFGGSGKAIEKSRQAACVSNLRQISSGLMMFAADNNGVLPAKYVAENGGQVMWSKALFPYLSPRNSASTSETAQEGVIFVCPAAKVTGYTKDKISRTYAGTGALLGQSAGAKEGDYNTDDFGRRLVAIQNPSQTILIVEGKPLTGSSTAACPSIIRFSGASPNIQADISAATPAAAPNLDYRHGESMNAIYGDGHLGVLAFKERSAIKEWNWQGSKYPN